MLIICPECGKEISDKSDKCIHCGYPISKTKTNIVIVNNKEYDFTNILLGINSESQTPASFVRMISDMCSIPIYEAKEIYFKIKDNKTLLEPITCEPKIQSLNQPHCPTCGSTNIEKISATSKAVGAVAFGLFSKTAKSQYKCKNCGYKW